MEKADDPKVRIKAPSAGAVLKTAFEREQPSDSVGPLRRTTASHTRLAAIYQSMMNLRHASARRIDDGSSVYDDDGSPIPAYLDIVAMFGTAPYRFLREGIEAKQGVGADWAGPNNVLDDAYHDKHPAASYAHFAARIEERDDDEREYSLLRDEYVLKEAREDFLIQTNDAHRAALVEVLQMRLPIASDAFARRQSGGSTGLEAPLDGDRLVLTNEHSGAVRTVEVVSAPESGDRRRTQHIIVVPALVTGLNT